MPTSNLHLFYRRSSKDKVHNDWRGNEQGAHHESGVLGILEKWLSLLISSQQHYVQDKVFIGMDHAPETFCLLDRLSGPGVSCIRGVWKLETYLVSSCIVVIKLLS